MADPLLGIIGAGVAALFGGAILWGRLRRFRVPQDNSWAIPPSIGITAPDLDSAVVEEAVRWWIRRGWELGPVRRGRGDITIEAWNPALADGDAIGRCEQQVHEGEILGAALMVARPRVVYVVHELGHALGFDHPRFCPTGHVMHPHKPGLKDDRGLEAP